MDAATLLADPAAIQLETYVSELKAITIIVRSVQALPLCPKCQLPSSSLHSNYQRLVADLPWHGVAIKLHLHTRKFRCRNACCPQKIFCERLPKVVAAYARKTVRLNDALTLLAFALGGEAGSRTAVGLGLAISGDSLLRRIRCYPLPALPTPKILGVDDWAKRKRHNYGSILVDLEKRQPIDLLPDREATTFAAWLKDHPGVEVICRDRAGAFAEGAAVGCPQAQQVVDRWHLLKNATDVLHRILQKQGAKLVEAYRRVIAPGAEAGPPAFPPQDRRAKAREHTRQRRLALYEKVRSLHQQGVCQAEMTRQLGISKPQVRRLMQAESFPERAPFPRRKTSVDGYADYLRRRWGEGCQVASQLWRELQEQGFHGPQGAVTRYVRNRLRDPQQVRVQYKRRVPRQAPDFAQPSAKQTTWLLLKDVEGLLEAEQQYVREVKRLCPEVNLAEELTSGFHRLVKEKQVEELSSWLAKAESGSKEWQNFALGIKRELEAVKAALMSEWSNGQTEGQVNRLKFVKRQMYGRGKLDLLRARVLHQV